MIKDPTRDGESIERHRTIRFELNKPLDNISTKGIGFAEATRLKFVDGDYELSNQIITVYSLDIPEGFDTPAETRGRAVWAPEAGRYEIVSMIHKARWFEFTVTDALAAGTSEQSCIVTEYHDGYDPGTPIKVHFDLKFEADGNNAGIATLGSDGKYHCRNIDCKV